MRVPNPRATTTTEAYLAYKAGYLVEEELKPVLYDPIYHYDAWLAYWCGLVNSYPTKANGEPEILTDEEALVAFLSGVTDTYPEEIKDPYNVRVVGYLKYLVSIRFGRPEYPTTNEEFYLSMIKPAVVTNSTPSSNIRLDNTVQGAFLSASIFGDTTQQSYSGKNLLKLSGRTNSGVTGTVNADGSYTISGTGTTTDGVSVFYFSRVLPAGTYTLSLSKALPKVINLTLESGVALRITAGSTSATITTTNEYTSGSVFFGIVNGESYDETFNMQLVAGDTPDYNFEPYVGGIPAPNPDYPQDVNVVTGEQTVTVGGKNLFNYQAVVNLALAGTISSGNTYRGYYIQSTAGETFTLSRAATTGNNRFRVCFTENEPANGVAFYNENGVQGQFIDANNRTSVSFTVPQGMNYVFIYLSNTGQTITESLHIQLETGSSATTYEPYQSQSYGINLGKNLFDKDNATLLEAYFDGSHTSITGASTNRTTYLKVKPNTTYTISKLLSVRNFIGATQTEPTVGTSVSNIASIGNGNYDGITRVSGTLTTGPNDNYIVVNYTNTNAETGDIPTNILNSIQIEEGSSATPYAPYFTPIELCKIGTYQDYIYKGDDGWYVHKATKKVILDGSGTWQNSGTNTVAYQGISDYAISGNTGFCSFSKAINNVASGSVFVNIAPDQSFAFNDGSIENRLYMKSSTLANAAGFVSWLRNNPSPLYYALATPTDTLITDNTLVGQLESLLQGGSYKGTTCITVTATGDNLPGLLQVEAGEYR